MTYKEQAQQAWATMTNAQKPISDRIAADTDLIDLKKQAKTSWEKLGIATEVFKAEQQALFEAAAVLDPLAEGKTVTFEKGLGKTQIPSSTKPSGDQRGLISAEVRCLLMDTDDSYKLIVEAVKAKFPNANTTTRSVASVAAELRKDGVKIAFRRPAKGA